MLTTTNTYYTVQSVKKLYCVPMVCIIHLSREVELRELVEEHHGEQQRQHRHRNLNDMSSRWAFLR